MTTEETLAECSRWLNTFAKLGVRELQVLRSNVPAIKKLEAVRDFASTRQKQPIALLRWIDEALERERMSEAMKDAFR